MSSPRLNFLVLVVLVLGGVAALAALVRPDLQRRNFEVFTEMAYSAAYESFAPNPNFADGRTLQRLVAGVVPRGQRPFAFGPGSDEALRAGRQLTNPLSAEDESVVALGAQLYGIFCVVCHDPRGTGHGRVTLRGMIPPPSFHAERALTMPDGEMFHVLTLGQGNMASYAAQLDERERWALIRHVRRLQQEGP